MKKPVPHKKVKEEKHTAPVLEQDDVEDVPDSEADAMIERAEEKKVAATKKVEKVVDTQEWTKMDPVIPEELEGRAWIAVYKCPHGHKTKATNRQADKGIQCFDCKSAGQTVSADIMEQFLTKPVKAADHKRKES